MILFMCETNDKKKALIETPVSYACLHYTRVVEVVAFSRRNGWSCKVESSWNVMAHGDEREGNWRGNWRMECVASTLYTTSEHYVSSITTADTHTSAASSRLNWRPPADLNGLVCFAERRNLVSARVPLHFKHSLLRFLVFFPLRFQVVFQSINTLCLSQWVLMTNPYFLDCYTRYMTIYLAVLPCAAYWLCHHPKMSWNVHIKQQRSSFVILEVGDCSLSLAKAFIRNTASLRAQSELFSIFCYSYSELVGFVSVIGGPGSSVGIATGYGLDDPGIEFRWRRDFPHLSRPALEPTQPPVQWWPVLSRG
jgi:hypothetical protein